MDWSDAKLQESGVVLSLVSSTKAHAALRVDGTVIAWGNPLCGGNYFGWVASGSLWGGAVQGFVREQLSSVVGLFSSQQAFAALRGDGTVVTWGDDLAGGDCSSVQAQLTEGVVQVTGTYGAFAAVKTDGGLVTWGMPQSGGDSRRVRQLLTRSRVQP